MKNVIISILSLSILLNSPIQAAPLDFDGDGISDTVTISRQNDDSPNEIVYNTILSSDNETYYLEYGKREDLLAPGDYNGDGVWELGLIKADSDNYTWQFRFGDNSNVENVSFGQSDDAFLSGCNFDEDNATELALLRENTFIFYNLENETESSFDISIPSNHSLKDIYCADTTGDGIAELFLLLSRSRNNKTKYKILAYNASGEQILKRRLRAADELFASLPENQSQNFIASILHRKNKSIISYYNNSGAVDNKLKLSSFSQATSSMRYNSIDELQSTIVYMDSLALYQHDYPSNDTALLEAPVSGDELLMSVNRYFTGNSNPEDPSDVCSEIMPAKDGANGFLWKQSDFHPGAVVLFPASYSNQVFSSVYAMKDGNKIDDFFFTAIANGNRQHWRSDQRASSFPDFSIIVAVQGNRTYCWQIEDSASRND